MNRDAGWSSQSWGPKYTVGAYCRVDAVLPTCAALLRFVCDRRCLKGSWRDCWHQQESQLERGGHWERRGWEKPFKLMNSISTGMATEQKDGRRYWRGDASVEETRAILTELRFGSWQQVWRSRCLYIAQGGFRVITRWLNLVAEHCTDAYMFHTRRKISWQCIHTLVQSLWFPWGFRVH